MNYIKKNIKIVLVSLVIGFLIAIFSRFSLFVFTSDFSYYKIGAQNSEVNAESGSVIGKELFGNSGFPFQTYAGCTVSYQGTMVGSSCVSSSIVNEFSIVLNTTFWASLFFMILICFRGALNYSKEKSRD